MYLTEYPSALAFTNILYRILLSLIPIFANECTIEFYIRNHRTKGNTYYIISPSEDSHTLQQPSCTIHPFTRANQGSHHSTHCTSYYVH